MPSTCRKPERISDVNSALRAVSGGLAAAIPALASVRPGLLLFVHDPSMKARARIFPLAFDATGTRLSRDGRRRRPVVRFAGRRMRYVVEYGPGFLRASRRRRLKTLVHELLHASPFFNGTLSRPMRHSAGGRARFDALVAASVETLLSASGNAPLRRLEFDPESEVLVWGRPFSLDAQGIFTDADLRRVRLGSVAGKCAREGGFTPPERAGGPGGKFA